MRPWHSQLPDISSLTLGLTSVFRNTNYSGYSLKVIDRRPNVYATTFPSEIVTCQVDEVGTELRLLCKYSAGQNDSNYNTFGHKGGVIYEAEVYRRALQKSESSLPTFYGTYIDPHNGWTWLILEHLDHCLPVNKLPRRLVDAVRWLGTFHAAFEAHMARVPLSYLMRYDNDYYVGWARRVSAYNGPSHENFPWLKTLCARFEEVVAVLLAATPTVIHGEFYPHNILVRDGAIFPVDWESAAVAPGEVDLAALIEKWATNIAKECELEYQRSRWPHGSPRDFQRTLDAARMYLHLRWLGQKPSHTVPKGFGFRLNELRSLGEQWGLL